MKKDSAFCFTWHRRWLIKTRLSNHETFRCPKSIVLIRNSSAPGQENDIGEKIQAKCPICGRLLGPRHDKYHAKFLAAPKCPSCRRLLGPRHEQHHAKYVATHRKAALEYQQKRRNDGQCIICGARRAESTAYCKEHLKQRRVTMRKRQTANPGKPVGLDEFRLTLTAYDDSPHTAGFMTSKSLSQRTESC